jgi:hypothetical protein
LGVKPPPIAVREMITVVAHIDGINEQLLCAHGLSEITAEVFFDQFHHLCRTLTRVPLISAKLAETIDVCNSVLQCANLGREI